MRWLVDGYNVIRRSPALASRETESLAAGREALCRLLSGIARVSGDQFAVVFDGAGTGGATSGGAGVQVVFSSARETADRVLARMAASAGAVVSNDREVRAAAARAGAVAVSADDFLARIERLRWPSPAPTADEPAEKDHDEVEADSARPKKGNPRRLPKKSRAAAKALRRLDRRG
jgi:predicted RNA-binding protein with PIN domain